jgi:hypothetical protein
MGICFPKMTPPRYKDKDEPLNPKPSAVVPTSSSPTYSESAPSVTPPSETQYSEVESSLPRVQLIGDVLCPFTLRVQIALQFKVWNVCNSSLFSFFPVFFLLLSLLKCE